MKNGKRPTRNQKQLLKKLGLNYQNWLIVKDTPGFIQTIHRFTGHSRAYNKPY
ncbi:hypothetical protein HYG86_09270 [Alkalicella caledoniensis]|uniref:DUF6906 domain-containing protein n=1 Tax=Alkalicella caledoniensis TaxID=2731377 RepID=A0A7G9W8D9_ALKCA|nr:hypothetical protein [Alkalicella caledoniensis]QNO14951.1 hypothetical protein HYG86_09270 [Alkalicella caledoniensis]